MVYQDLCLWKFISDKISGSFLLLSPSPVVYAGPVQGEVGPDGGEHLLIVTDANLLNEALLQLPANRDPDQRCQIWAIQEYVHDLILIFWKTSAPHRPSSRRPPRWSRSGGSWPASAPACGCKSPPRHWRRPVNPSGVRQSEVFAFVYLVLDRDKLSVLAGQAQLVSPSVSAGAIHHSGGGLVPEAPVTVEIQTVSMSFKVVILWILSHNTVYRS